MTAILRDRKEAERVLGDLSQAGVPAVEVSVAPIGDDAVSAAAVGANIAKGAAAGGAVGGSLGAIAGGVLMGGAVLVATGGAAAPLLAAPIAGVLAGGGAGAALGSVIGAVVGTSAGAPATDSVDSGAPADVRPGDTVLDIQVDYKNVDEIHQILDNAV